MTDRTNASLGYLYQDRRLQPRRAWIFDLDGTLTIPMLDFDAIRSELGLGPGPILEALRQMNENDRLLSAAVLERHEREAAEDSILQPGAAETLDGLRMRGGRIALLTRNARRWTRLTLDKHGLAVDALRCREDGAIKPSAEPVLSLCAELGCRPADSWVVGDFRFDIESGLAAGCLTVLMLGDRPPPDYAGFAHYCIRRLPELLDLADGRCRS